MQGREHNASPSPSRAYQAPLLTAMMLTCPHLTVSLHLHMPHRHAPCTGLPPACKFSFFLFLLTSSFVVQSPHSHHHQHNDHDRDHNTMQPDSSAHNTTRGMTTTPTTPTWHNNCTCDTHTAQ